MKRLFFLILLIGSVFGFGNAWAQCAPGVVSAGNPGCIPQDRFESPVYQGPPPGYSGDYGAPTGRPIDPKYGAFAVDNDFHVSFAYLFDSEDRARGAAMKRCQESGGTNCQSLTFKSTCGALVANKNGDIWLGAGRASAAMNDAYQKCSAKDPRGQCHFISLSVCSIPQDDMETQQKIGKMAADATPADLARNTSKSGESRPWYGAFAYGPNEDSLHISMDDIDKDESIKRVLAQCKGADCKLLDWINRQCGGIGLPRDPSKKGQYIATVGDTPEYTRDQVQMECKSKFGSQCNAIIRCTGDKYAYPDNNPFPSTPQASRQTRH